MERIWTFQKCDEKSQSFATSASVLTTTLTFFSAKQARGLKGEGQLQVLITQQQLMKTFANHWADSVK